MADPRSSAPRLDRLSLESLRVFEAAARHANFSAAARERGVTQAAVSRRIQTLEQELGAALFLRRGRRLSLTAQGARLARRVRGALDYLAEGLEGFAPEGQVVSLAASGAVSHLWLGAALRGFAAAHPAVSVRLLTTDAMDALAAESHDLAILYGGGAHPAWRLTPLLPERLAPVAAPGYLAGRDASDLAALDLLDYEPFNAHWKTLRDWFVFAGARAPRVRLMFTTYATAMEACLRGDGVALGSLALIARHLESGALARLPGPVWETGMGYHLGLPRGRESGEAALALRQTLLAAAGA